MVVPTTNKAAAAARVVPDFILSIIDRFSSTVTPPKNDQRRYSPGEMTNTSLVRETSDDPRDRLDACGEVEAGAEVMKVAARTRRTDSHSRGTAPAAKKTLGEIMSITKLT
jgi:hypothetical protein